MTTHQQATGSSAVSESLKAPPPDNENMTVAVPLEMIEGMMKYDALIEEDIHVFCGGIENGDNPDITLTQEACFQIRLVNDHLPKHRGLSIPEDRIVAMDDFCDFLNRVRDFVGLIKKY